MFLFNISDSNTNWFYLIGICWASISIPLRRNWTKALTGWIHWLCCNNGARFDQTNSIQSPSHEKSSRRGKKSGGRNNTIDEADVNQTENLKWIVKETLRLRFPVMITRATLNWKVMAFLRIQKSLWIPGQFKGIPNSGTILKSLSGRDLQG